MKNRFSEEQIIGFPGNISRSTGRMPVMALGNSWEKPSLERSVFAWIDWRGTIKKVGQPPVQPLDR